MYWQLPMREHVEVNRDHGLACWWVGRLFVHAASVGLGESLQAIAQGAEGFLKAMLAQTSSSSADPLNSQFAPPHNFSPALPR